MNRSLIWKTAAGALLAGSLAACGGGSSSSGTDAAAETPAPTSFVVSGTAATGAAFANASVTLTGSDGTSYPGAGEAAVLTDADGSYSITLPVAAKPPFVVQAARDDQTLVSVVPEAKDSTANITPVTNLIASRLSESGDPVKLAQEIQAKPELIDATKLKAKVDEIVALIKPVMDAVGDSTDPLSGKFVADGKGADRVLDSLSITITPSSASTVNIAVAVKQKQAEGEQPTVIAFTNTTAPAASLPTVSATDLVESGTAELIADLLKRMAACYALPQAERVSANGTTAADIIASACKDLFVGNDPAAFLNNGAKVGATGAFSSIFGAGTGASFDRGSYEFTRTNGDLVIAYRATSSEGNSSNNTLVVRADTDGKLRAIGNQYKYNGGVNAYHQLRTFINQSGADYYSTGYNLTVTNVLDANKASIFEKVVVTSPKGNSFTLKPSAGSSYLPLVKNGSVTGTNFVRIRSVYTDAANSAKNPADADTSNFFSANPLTDEEIAALPAQAVWKFDYYLAGNTTATPDETQYYKTRARAMTIAELQSQPMANVLAADIASAKASSVSANGNTYLPADPASPLDFGWEVPEGALEPTNLQAWGVMVDTSTNPATRTPFNDKASVKSSARSGAIACSAGGAGDNHCNGSNYVAADRFTGLHLWAEDAAGRDFAHFYAFYTIAP